MLGTAKAKLKQPGEMEMRKKWKKKPGGEIAKYSREKEEKYEPFHQKEVKNKEILKMHSPTLDC